MAYTKEEIKAAVAAQPDEYNIVSRRLRVFLMDLADILKTDPVRSVSRLLNFHGVQTGFAIVMEENGIFKRERVKGSGRKMHTTILIPYPSWELLDQVRSKYKERRRAMTHQNKLNKKLPSLMSKEELLDHLNVSDNKEKPEPDPKPIIETEKIELSQKLEGLISKTIVKINQSEIEITKYTYRQGVDDSPAQ